MPTGSAGKFVLGILGARFLTISPMLSVESLTGCKLNQTIQLEYRRSEVTIRATRPAHLCVRIACTLEAPQALRCCSRLRDACREKVTVLCFRNRENMNGCSGTHRTPKHSSTRCRSGVKTGRVPAGIAGPHVIVVSAASMAYFDLSRIFET